MFQLSHTLFLIVFIIFTLVVENHLVEYSTKFHSSSIHKNISNNLLENYPYSPDIIINTTDPKFYSQENRLKIIKQVCTSVEFKRYKLHACQSNFGIEPRSRSIPISCSKREKSWWSCTVFKSLHSITYLKN